MKEFKTKKTSHEKAIKSTKGTRHFYSTLYPFLWALPGFGLGIFIGRHKIGQFFFGCSRFPIAPNHFINEKPVGIKLHDFTKLIFYLS